TAALDGAREIDGQREQARALEGIGRCRISLGDKGAVPQLREAIDIYRRIGAPEAASAAAYLASVEPDSPD
ncbi:hypothetical protein ACW9HQ_52200, partial [Nocardia gipuzkoensis]